MTHVSFQKLKDSGSGRVSEGRRCHMETGYPQWNGEFQEEHHLVTSPLTWGRMGDQQ